jgi:hypothetical protein
MGYVRQERRKRGVRGQKIYLHRYLLRLQPGDGLEGDHKDGDPLNNRRSNLRVCIHALNHQNKAKCGGTSSRFLGVSWDSARGKWYAYGTVDGKMKNLGRYDDEDRAAVAALEWRRRNMPFFVGR